MKEAILLMVVLCGCGLWLLLTTPPAREGYSIADNDANHER